ncbi:CDP-archaeol synthase [Candidatus Woesearchaeota archaeon]|nr:CDP-archaeol synthase [Candidatus Woesearchaeota archaeon]
MIPAAVANMAPAIFSRVPFMDYPIDFGKKLKGRPILGSHKTFRGFFFGIVCAILLVYAQSFLYSASAYFRGISVIDYSSINFALLGFLMGFGTLLGDSVESFLKRRVGIRPGKRWVPWDQIDWIVGMLILLAIVYVPPIGVIAFLIIVFPLLHIAVKHIGYYIKINDEKW